MFITKTSENDFFLEMEKELNKINHKDEVNKKVYRDKALLYLKAASYSLKNAGLIKEANLIKKIYTEDNANSYCKNYLEKNKVPEDIVII